MHDLQLILKVILSSFFAYTAILSAVFFLFSYLPPLCLSFCCSIISLPPSLFPFHLEGFQLKRCFFFITSQCSVCWGCIQPLRFDSCETSSRAFGNSCRQCINTCHPILWCKMLQLIHNVSEFFKVSGKRSNLIVGRGLNFVCCLKSGQGQKVNLYMWTYVPVIRCCCGCRWTKVREKRVTSKILVAQADSWCIVMLSWFWNMTLDLTSGSSCISSPALMIQGSVVCIFLALIS